MRELVRQLFETERRFTAFEWLDVRRYVTGSQLWFKNRKVKV